MIDMRCTGELIMAQYCNTGKHPKYTVYIPPRLQPLIVSRDANQKVLKISSSDSSLQPKALPIQSLIKWKVKRQKKKAPMSYILAAIAAHRLV